MEIEYFERTKGFCKNAIICNSSPADCEHVSQRVHMPDLSSHKLSKDELKSSFLQFESLLARQIMTTREPSGPQAESERSVDASDTVIALSRSLKSDSVEHRRRIATKMRTVHSSLNLHSPSSLCTTSRAGSDKRKLATRNLRNEKVSNGVNFKILLGRLHCRSAGLHSDANADKFSRKMRKLFLGLRNRNRNEGRFRRKTR